MLAVDRAADPEGLQLREQQHAGRCRAHAQPCGRFGAGRAADRLTRARRALVLCDATLVLLRQRERGSQLVPGREPEAEASAE